MPQLGQRRNGIEINFWTSSQACICASRNRSSAASARLINVRCHIALRKRIAELRAKESAMI